jgi:hypothetical protein
MLLDEMESCECRFGAFELLLNLQNFNSLAERGRGHRTVTPKVDVISSHRVSIATMNQTEISVRRAWQLCTNGFTQGWVPAVTDRHDFELVLGRPHWLVASVAPVSIAFWIAC